MIKVIYRVSNPCNEVSVTSFKCAPFQPRLYGYFESMCICTTASNERNCASIYLQMYTSPKSSAKVRRTSQNIAKVIVPHKAIAIALDSSLHLIQSLAET